jgi:SagB-type dehydrogenase family enzyme
MYHYDPKEHTLTRISDYNDKLEKLLKDASRASARDYLPDTLITYTARFQRFMWKYQSMAYAVILKDAGLLMQNMYLVATAMNLAPCAIGNGDSDLFAEASGLDYYVEGSVGEFTLESKKK